jgi:hypothetical protein
MAVLQNGRDETDRLAERGADGVEDTGRGCSLILQGKGRVSRPAQRRVILFF